MVLLAALAADLSLLVMSTLFLLCVWGGKRVAGTAWPHLLSLTTYWHQRWHAWVVRVRVSVWQVPGAVAAACYEDEGQGAPFLQV
jgi:hypothetical protein